MSYQAPPQQVVKIIDWNTLVTARDLSSEFPVTYSFGTIAPDYLDIGVLSRAFAGTRGLTDLPRPEGDAGRAFIEIDPYGWVS
jgi:hypothetical protein